MHAYRASRAFDGERVLPGGALVLVSGSTILAVESGTAAAPADCPVTELPGGTLLPGLIDAHVHLCGDGGPRALDQLPELGDDELDAIVATSLAIQLASGVTAVRDLGDARWTVVDRHRTHPEGPTVVGSGPPITCPHGHCAGMGGEASGEDGLRRAVRERAEHGVDVVKVMTSGGMLTEGTDVTQCQFTLTELRPQVDFREIDGIGAGASAGRSQAARGHTLKPDHVRCRLPSAGDWLQRLTEGAGHWTRGRRTGDGALKPPLRHCCCRPLAGAVPDASPVSAAVTAGRHRKHRRRRPPAPGRRPDGRCAAP